MNESGEIGRVPSGHRSNLPVLVGRSAPRHKPAVSNAGAEFISQLLAERDNLPVQRERRRASVAVAVGSYDATAAQSVRRMPPGYRRSLLA